MAILTNMVFDRTQSDVDALVSIMQKANAQGFDSLTQAELDFIKTAQKGAYNAADVNRVVSAYNTLVADLAAEGYPVTLAGTIPTKAASGLLLDTEGEVYLQNVEIIRSALPVFDDTPPTPTTMNNLTFQKANDIEKILYDVSVAIQNMIDAYFYSGELYCGEV